MLHIVTTDKSTDSDHVTRIGQALCDLIESFDIETLIEDGETPRGYIIDPEKGILRDGSAATGDAAMQLGITLLGRMLFDLGGPALMQLVRDQVVAVAVAEQFRMDSDQHRRWLTHLFKVCWKGIA